MYRLRPSLLLFDGRGWLLFGRFCLFVIVWLWPAFFLVIDSEKYLFAIGLILYITPFLALTFLFVLLPLIARVKLRKQGLVIGIEASGLQLPIWGHRKSVDVPWPMVDSIELAQPPKYGGIGVRLCSCPLTEADWAKRNRQKDGYDFFIPLDYIGTQQQIQELVARLSTEHPVERTSLADDPYYANRFIWPHPKTRILLFGGLLYGLLATAKILFYSNP